MSLPSPSGRVTAHDVLSKLTDPDDDLIDAATRASLRGVSLEPVRIDVAIEDPRNRDAIARALKAAAEHLARG